MYSLTSTSYAASGEEFNLNEIKFLNEVLENFPFPIQRIQSDWGTEFFNDMLQEELMVHFIKFRPIKPRTPHLNGKVERSQKTDKVEFYSLLNLKDRVLPLEYLLAEWEYFYNYLRPHASLGGKMRCTPFVGQNFQFFKVEK